VTQTAPDPDQPDPAEDGPDRPATGPDDQPDSLHSDPHLTPQPSAVTAEDRARELQRLHEQLAECRREREQAERDAGAEVMLLRGIAAVRRDRDAGTSATLRRDRVVFERLLGDIDELVVLAARTSVRLAVYGLPADHPHVQSGIAAGNAGLDAAAALAAALATALDPPSTTPQLSTDDRANGPGARRSAAGSAA
jgi:hypothetical protein